MGSMWSEEGDYLSNYEPAEKKEKKKRKVLSKQFIPGIGKDGQTNLSRMYDNDGRPIGDPEKK